MIGIIIGLFVGLLLGGLGILFWIGHGLSNPYPKQKKEKKPEPEVEVANIPQLEWEIPSHWEGDIREHLHWTAVFNNHRVWISLREYPNVHDLVWVGADTEIFSETLLVEEEDQNDPVIQALLAQAREQSKKAEIDLKAKVGEEDRKRKTDSKLAVAMLSVVTPEEPAEEVKAD